MSSLGRTKKAVAVAVALRRDAPEWRLQLANAIAHKRIDVKYPHCDRSHLRDIVSIPKTSASTTGIFFGKHTGLDEPRDITIKASFAPASEDSLLFDNSLVTERVNYQVIANELIRRRWTPNLASYVASFQCSGEDIRKLDSKGVYRAIKDSMYSEGFSEEGEPLGVIEAAREEQEGNGSMDFYEPQYNFDLVNFVVTERLKGKKLETWMATKRSLDAWKSVLFQILYTLEVFNRIGFRHNDLHLENVFIEDLSGTTAPDNTMYVIELHPGRWEYVLLPTKNHNVRIYDFDRSTLLCTRGTINKKYWDLVGEYKANMPGGLGCTNTRMLTRSLVQGVKSFTHCESEGACHEPNKKFDAFTVLGLLWAADERNTARMKKLYGRDSAGLFDHAVLPNEVLAFIERHLSKEPDVMDPLTTRWNWPYRMSRVEERPMARQKWVVKGDNMELPDEYMSSVYEMLQDRNFFDFARGGPNDFEEQCDDAFIYHLPARPDSEDADLSDLKCEAGRGAEEKEMQKNYEIEVSGDDWRITLYPGTRREKSYDFNPRECALAKRGLTVPVLRAICNVVSDQTIKHNGLKKAQMVQYLEAFLRSLSEVESK